MDCTELTCPAHGELNRLRADVRASAERETRLIERVESLADEYDAPGSRVGAEVAAFIRAALYQPNDKGGTEQAAALLAGERARLIELIEAEARMQWQTDTRRAGLRRAIEVIREAGQ